jgi:AcrR family transcriptional regulator
MEPMTTGSTTRKRTALSLDAIVDEAVALLDAHGARGLTFRALAARLNAGVGSVYWYIDSKEELIYRASDRVTAEVLTQVREADAADDVLDALRGAAQAIFEAITQHPWLGLYFMRNTATASGLLFYEWIGEQVMRLDLGPRETFHATSAIMGYSIAVANDLGQRPTPTGAGDQGPADQPTPRDQEADNDQQDFAAAWRSLDPQTYPFLHYVVDEFGRHKDAEEFIAGLDLILAGLNLQAQAHAQD